MANEHSIFKLKPQALCRAYLASAQDNILNETDTKVNLDAETYDPGSCFDTTNNRFQAPVAGFYTVKAQVGFKNTTSNKVYSAKLTVGAVTKAISFEGIPVAMSALVPVSDIIQMAADDYLYLYCYHESGKDTDDLINAAYYTYMAVHFLSAS